MWCVVSYNKTWFFSLVFFWIKYIDVNIILCFPSVYIYLYVVDDCTFDKHVLLTSLKQETCKIQLPKKGYN